jgi:hypothetical protein
MDKNRCGKKINKTDITLKKKKLNESKVYFEQLLHKCTYLIVYSYFMHLTFFYCLLIIYLECVVCPAVDFGLTILSDG